MMMLLLLLLVLSSSDAVTPVGVKTCDQGDSRLLHCARTLFDADHDDVITQGDVIAAFAPGGRIYYDANLTPEIIMLGDYTLDGNLTMDDWNHPNNTFVTNVGYRGFACFFCRANGINMDP